MIWSCTPKGSPTPPGPERGYNRRRWPHRPGRAPRIGTAAIRAAISPRGLTGSLVICVLVLAWSAGPSAAGTLLLPRVTAVASRIAPEPSPGCHATPAAAPGEVTLSLTSDGMARSYIRHLPPSYDGRSPDPLVLDLPGYSETPAIEALMTQLGPFGDAHRFITVTPQEQGPVAHWDTSLGSVDVRFIGNLLTETEQTLCLDQRRVFVAGLSDGAFMTSTVACVYADRVAAVAPVAGIRNPAGCRPARAVPVIAFHGTADPFVAFAGGLGASALNLPAADGSGRTVGQTLSPAATKGPSIPQITAAWAKRNRCPHRPTAQVIASDVTLIRYRCPAQADVELYRITAGGHSWPGSAFSQAIASVVGHTTFSISADQLIWAFFEQHPLIGR
jgi:polyhydroxybutyrate depolymerase